MDNTLLSAHSHKNLIQKKEKPVEATEFEKKEFKQRLEQKYFQVEVQQTQIKFDENGKDRIQQINKQLKSDLIELKGDGTLLQKLGEKAKTMAELFKTLSKGFFESEYELEKAEQELKVKQTNYFKKAKGVLKNVILILVSLSIVIGYLDVLGLEESQNLKYASLTSLSYASENLPRLLPVHQFISFETSSVKDRIRCLIYNDEQQCLRIEQLRCELKGKSSEAYEECMIDLIRSQLGNATQFCKDHYLDESIWVDNMSPFYLQYYLRKHNCLGMAGFPKGKDYCLDYFLHEDSWGQVDLFQCYTRYNVNFGKEFCDAKFSGSKVLLMQCYAVKNVDRGREFCNSNFDPEKDLENFLLCYESIPVYSMEYCQLKHPKDIDQKIDCFRNKARLVLDQQFCDNKYPITAGADGNKIFDERYACYKEIQLEGKSRKDIEYCEYINLEDTLGKYECIDALNGINAEDDAVYECKIEDDGLSMRKEKQVCKIYKKITILELDYKTPMKKGADYCYFTYPWEDLSQEKYDCLVSQGLEPQYLSSSCLESFNFNNQVAQKLNEYYDIELKYKCLENYGIKYEPNQCSTYLLMPRNQKFVIEKLTQDKIVGYESSQNLKENITDYKYKDIEGESLMNSKIFYYIGSLSSIQLQRDYIIWVLEHGYKEFLQQSDEYKLPQNLTSSFGHFMFKQKPFQRKQQLEEAQKQIYQNKHQFDNPLLETEDISVQKILDLEDINQEKARRASENIIYALGVLYQQKALGQVLLELDALFTNFILPKGVLANIYADLQTMTPREAIVELSTEWREFKSEEVFLVAMQQLIDSEVAIYVLFDLQLSSPLFNLLMSQYKDAQKQPIVGGIINEVYQIMASRANSTNPKIRLDELIEEAMTKPTLQEIHTEYNQFLDSKFERKLPPTLSGIVAELELEYFVDEAIQIVVREYNRKHFTLEAAKILISELQNTESASKLVSEFYTGGNKTYYTLLDELEYANSQNILFQEKLDLLVQQKQMSKIVDDIFQVLGTEMQNGTTISKKMIHQKDLKEITSEFSNNPVYNSFFKMIYDQPNSVELSNQIGQKLSIDDLPVIKLLDSIINYKTYSFIFKEYRDDLLANQSRRLQETSWEIGSWNFEDPYQVVARLQDQEIRFTLLDQKTMLVMPENVTLRSDDKSWDTNNQRGKLTYKVAIHEMMGYSQSQKPSLKCHFSGDYIKNPWWKMEFDQEYAVRSVTIFNTQNGAITSNLEGATIYVGDTICGKLGPQLPVNSFVTINCQDLTERPSNVFEQNWEKQEYTGTKGRSIKIVSNQPGVLVVCDLDIEISVVDQKFEDEIDRQLAKCKVWQDQCREDFQGDLNYENRVNCLLNYGVNKTAEYCLLQLNQVSSDFRYPLKHKYECLSSPSNDFPATQISLEAGECLNEYFDYMVEKCLEEYEYHFNSQMGFNGPDQRPQEDDALAYKSLYWSQYGNLTLSIEDQLDLVIEEIKDKTVDTPQVNKPIEVSDYIVKEFLCRNAQMLFYSNPFDSLTVYKTACEAFQIKEKTYLHFFFQEQLQFDGKVTDTFLVNRTDANSQYFNLTFSNKLEFLQVLDNSMFFREQNPQSDSPEIPRIMNSLDLKDFISQPQSLKLFEGEQTMIGYEKMQDTNLVSFPFRNTSISVAKHNGFLLLNRWPIQFTDTLDDKIIINPEVNKRLALPIASFSFIIHLKFDFFKQSFQYRFSGLDTLLTRLGGSSNAANEILMGLGSLFLMVWILQFAYYVKQKASNDYKENIYKYKERIDQYKEIIKQKFPDNLEDLIKIEKIMQEESDEQQEGGIKEQLQISGLKERLDQMTYDEAEDLKLLEEKYGRYVRGELLSDFQQNKKHLQEQDDLGYLDIVKKAKRNISFLGVFFTNDKQNLLGDNLDALYDMTEKQLKDLQDKQNILADLSNQSVDSVINEIIKLKVIKAQRELIPGPVLIRFETETIESEHVEDDRFRTTKQESDQDDTQQNEVSYALVEEQVQMAEEFEWIEEIQQEHNENVQEQVQWVQVEMQQVPEKINNHFKRINIMGKLDTVQSINSAGEMLSLEMLENPVFQGMEVDLSLPILQQYKDQYQNLNLNDFVANSVDIKKIGDLSDHVTQNAVETIEEKDLEEPKMPSKIQRFKIVKDRQRYQSQESIYKSIIDAIPIYRNKNNFVLLEDEQIVYSKSKERYMALEKTAEIQFYPKIYQKNYRMNLHNAIVRNSFDNNIDEGTNRYNSYDPFAPYKSIRNCVQQPSFRTQYRKELLIDDQGDTLKNLIKQPTSCKNQTKGSTSPKQPWKTKVTTSASMMAPRMFKSKKNKISAWKQP